MSKVSQQDLLISSFNHFIQVVGLVLAIPTAIITIIRLTVRARARNLGLDDAFAASSLAGLLVFYTALFLHFDPHRTPFSRLVVPPRPFYHSASSCPLFLHDEVRNVLCHLPRLLLGHMVTFQVLHAPFFHFLTLKPRSARLSLMFIVIRITPPSNEGTRRTLYFAAWSFGAAWAVLAAQVIWVCEKKVAWKVSDFVKFNARFVTATFQVTPAPQCPIGLPVAIAQLISTARRRS